MGGREERDVLKWKQCHWFREGCVGEPDMTGGFWSKEIHIPSRENSRSSGRVVSVCICVCVHALGTWHLDKVAGV